MPRRTYTYQRRLRLQLLEHGEHDRRVHHRPVVARSSSCNIVCSRRKATAPSRSAMAADPWDARSLEWMIPSPDARATTSTRSPTVADARRVLAPQVRRGRGRPAGAHRRRPRTSSRRATPPTSTCRRRRTGRSCSPSACRSSPTASSTTCGSACSARSVVVAGIYGWVMEPSTDPDAGHGHDDHDDARPRRPRRRPRPTADEPTQAARRPRRRRSLTDLAAARRAAEPARPRRAHEHVTSTGISNEKLAMWVFLGSECLLFGGLISTYLLYRAAAVRRPDARTSVYDIPFTSVSSFVLLMSSLTMVLAVGGHPAGRRPPHARLAAHHRAARRLVHRRPGLRVHEFYNEGLGFTTNLLRLGLLHAHRLPRRPRHRRHRHAAVARRACRCGARSAGARPRPSRSSACTGTSSTSCGS